MKHYCRLVLQFGKNSLQRWQKTVLSDSAFTFFPWLLGYSDLSRYVSESSKWYTEAVVDVSRDVLEVSLLGEEQMTYLGEGFALRGSGGRRNLWKLTIKWILLKTVFKEFAKSTSHGLRLEVHILHDAKYADSWNKMFMMVWNSLSMNFFSH